MFRLFHLYLKKDDEEKWFLTDKIFSGDYGSDLEQSLEDEEDEVENKLEYMSQTMQRWEQAEVCF